MKNFLVNFCALALFVLILAASSSASAREDRAALANRLLLRAARENGLTASWHLYSYGNPQFAFTSKTVTLAGTSTYLQGETVLQSCVTVSSDGATSVVAAAVQFHHSGLDLGGNLAYGELRANKPGEPVCNADDYYLATTYLFNPTPLADLLSDVQQTSLTETVDAILLNYQDTAGRFGMWGRILLEFSKNEDDALIRVRKFERGKTKPYYELKVEQYAEVDGISFPKKIRSWIGDFGFMVIEADKISVDRGVHTAEQLIPRLPPRVQMRYDGPYAMRRLPALFSSRPVILDEVDTRIDPITAAAEKLAASH